MNRKELQELLDIWNHSSVIKKKRVKFTRLLQPGKDTTEGRNGKSPWIL